jgi:chemotaxis signal transduction protein
MEWRLAKKSLGLLAYAKNRVDPQGRRLCLLVEAGEGRYAVDATSVVEVSPPDADGKSLRGVLEIVDLSSMLGGAQEERPGMAVVLDVSPTLAARVRRVLEVADVARAAFFQLPPVLGDKVGARVRGALLHRDELYLELLPEALTRSGNQVSTAGEGEVGPLVSPPDRALVLVSQGELFGLPLSWVLQVVSGPNPYTPLPPGSSTVAGLLAHGQTLWPVYSLPGLLHGRSQGREGLFVLAEVKGTLLAVFAERVVGIRTTTRSDARPGSFEAEGLPGTGLFLDLQRILP